MATVSLQHIYKEYPSDKGAPVVAVTDFCLDIKDREFVVFVGPSGCGKSTTLRMIAGLEEISRGDIFIGDRRINDVSPKDRDIAMVFQNYALYPHMSVFENMAFGLKLRKVPKPEIQRRVSDAAAILGIEDYLDRKPKALSGGQRQRVAVGRAIVRQPKVFLFDEPLSNLDAKMRVQMRTEITKLHQRLQATMIYVTHDQVEAMTMGTRIVVMKDGLVQQADAPLELYNKPANQFVASFLGSPQMNLITGTLQQKGSELVFHEDGQGSLKIAIESRPETIAFVGKPVVFGIRPENCDVVLDASTVQSKSTTAFQAVVDLVEPMGSETYLHVTTGQHSMIIRSDSAIGHEMVGRRMRFVVDTSKTHLFDPSNGQRI